MGPIKDTTELVTTAVGSAFFSALSFAKVMGVILISIPIATLISKNFSNSQCYVKPMLFYTLLTLLTFIIIVLFYLQFMNYIAIEIKEGNTAVRQVIGIDNAINYNIFYITIVIPLSVALFQLFRKSRNT